MRKVVLYAAISVDGFIAGPNGETPWSEEEWTAFQQFVRSCDICLLGRHTYEIMLAGNEFIEDGHYVVVTTDEHFSGKYPAIKIDSARDIPAGDKVGVIGGGELNGRLAVMGVIDEIILDIEPIVLGAGVRLFRDYAPRISLQLVGSQPIGSSTVQNHYSVQSRQG